MTGFVVDLSWAWPTATGALLRSIGATGVIAYAGCNDTSKNVSKARFQDWAATPGLDVGLVVENGERDLEGAGAGVTQAQALLAAAAELGYDRDNSVLFCGFDANAVAGDYAAILAGWNAYAARVPVPGYYGDSDSMAYLAEHAPKPPVVYWQSDSLSFSPENPSPHAHLLQRFADPRSAGLTVDVNDIRQTPLRLMGEDTDMPLSPDDLAAIGKLITRSHDNLVTEIRQDRDNVNDVTRQEVQANRGQLNDVLTGIAGLRPAADVITAKGTGVSDRVAQLGAALTQQAQALAKLPGQVAAALPAGSDTAAVEQAVATALAKLKLTGTIEGGLQ